MAVIMAVVVVVMLAVTQRMCVNEDGTGNDADDADGVMVATVMTVA